MNRIFRVKKQDSAFVYFILESYEGIASYSTLDAAPGCPYRDLELSIPADFYDEVQEVMTQLGDLTYEITTSAESVCLGLSGH